MRLSHTMIRVGNLDKSIAFYTDLLGMQIFKQKEYPTGKFTLVFLGYRENEALIELTHNWETDHYELGDGFGHLAIEVPDIYAFCSDIKNQGGSITREPGPMKSGTTVIAFIEDPDGYKIEVIQKKET